MNARAAPTLWEGADAATWRARWRIPALELYARTGSTSDHARRLAEAGATAGTVVIADEQTAGRGRQGRRWTAPAGRALLLSVVLRPGPDGRAPATAALRVALALAHAIEHVAGIVAGIKWPNDLVVAGHGKVAGILCEGSIGPGASGYVVAGVGVNTGQSETDFPEELRGRASSLGLLAGRTVPRADLAGRLLDALRPFDLGGLEPLDDDRLREIRRRDCLLGAYVALADGQAGTAAGIAPDGALVLETPAGPRHIRHGSIRSTTHDPATADTDWHQTGEPA